MSCTAQHSTAQHSTAARIIASLALALSLAAPQAHADLVLSGEPNMADAQEQNKRFELAAQELSKALGTPVKYSAPLNALDHADKTRSGAYDINITSAVVASWLAKKSKANILLAADDPTTFLIVTPSTQQTISSPEQLIGKPVCLMHSPHLSALMFFSMYGNPVQQPSQRLFDGYDDIIDALLNGKCEAGVVKSDFYERTLSKESKEKLRVAFNTRAIPGRVLAVSNNVSPEQRAALSKVVSQKPAESKVVQSLTNAAIRGVDPQKMLWKTANSNDFQGLDKVLVEQSYGWN